MNKNLKKIISVVLTVSAFCVIAPATNLNIVSTKAYASSRDADELTRLKLKESDGGSITLYDDDRYRKGNKVNNYDIKEGDTYYAKTSSGSIKIDTDGVDEDKVRIFKGSSKKSYKVGDKISLSSGTTAVKVKVYKKDYKDYDDYDEAEDSSYNEYTIKVKCTSSRNDKDDEDDNQDEIYLNKLKITHDGDSISGFNFKEEKSSYNITVPESFDDVRITAEPDNDDDRVIVDGYIVNDDNDYRRTVDLVKGKKNVIEVQVKNGSDKRTYTLNITRGGDSSTNEDYSSKKTNQWVFLNGRWTYNDSLGNQLRNTWFYDKNYGKTYYLQYDGSMATGWLYKDGTWYYLAGNGEKQTGWTFASGNWYYLDGDGKMQTGWLRDWNGKWYYLESTGAMAKNTTINGYRLGWDGAWIN